MISAASPILRTQKQLRTLSALHAPLSSISLGQGNVRLRAFGLVLVSTLVVGCSPYLYKTEINGFSAGVDDLGSAYSSGLKGTTTERLERQRWQWGTAHSSLALTEGCIVAPLGGADQSPLCALREVGKSVPQPSPIEREAAAAAPIVKALRAYADGLAAVTNAEDQEALEAAQVQFRDSIQGLVKQHDPKAAASLGPIADLFSALTTAILNKRRYEILRDGVTAANQPVAELGRAMGDTLDAIRIARANELRLTANLLVDELGPKVRSTDYVSRLGLIEDKVSALEVLRRSNPKQAAQDMIDAHEKLTRALNDDRRQTQAVVTSVRAFVEKAKAVREAFSG